MGGVLQSAFTFILSVEFIIGNLGNGFIVLVNCMDWVKRRNISSVDQILTALAISRICLLWSVVISLFLFVLFPGLLMPAELFRIIKFPWMVTNHFSLWLVTSLSIFYFLKIANFSNSTFLYLKWRVKKVVSVVLLMSLVFLLLNIVLVSTNTAVKIEGCKTNLSYHSSLRNSAQFSRFQVFIYSAFYFIPFTVFLTTFLLLVFSMWKHLKKMRQNAQGSRDASTIAHIKALQTVIAFLLLYTIFFITLVVQLWTFELQEKNLIILFCQAFGIAFPSCHSFILILRNSKLRQASLLVLWWLRCRSKDVEILSP